MARLQLRDVTSGSVCACSTGQRRGQRGRGKAATLAGHWSRGRKRCMAWHGMVIDRSAVRFAASILRLFA